MKIKLTSEPVEFTSAFFFVPYQYISQFLIFANIDPRNIPFCSSIRITLVSADEYGANLECAGTSREILELLAEMELINNSIERSTMWRHFRKYA